MHTLTTTSAPGGTGSWVTLSGPAITENNAGEIPRASVENPQPYMDSPRSINCFLSLLYALLQQAYP